MEKLITRRVKHGYNESESRELLTQLLDAHDGDNLEYALVYNQFTTPAAAAKFVATR